MADLCQMSEVFNQLYSNRDDSHGFEWPIESPRQRFLINLLTHDWCLSDFQISETIMPTIVYVPSRYMMIDIFASKDEVGVATDDVICRRRLHSNGAESEE